MLAVITFIIILGLLVFVHEAGHFFVARRAGIAVSEFGFGFPPRIIGFQRMNGKWRIVRRSTHVPDDAPTVYSVNWIPLGGFVRLKGENGEDAQDANSFAAQPKRVRGAVLLAGVGMNLVLAWFLFTLVGSIGIAQVLDGPTDGARVRDIATKIVGVIRDAPADRVGLQPGDAMTAIDGVPMGRLEDVQRYIREHAERALAITVRNRDGERTVAVTPVVLAEVPRPGIGVQLVETGIVSYPIHRAAWEGVRMTGFVLRDIVVNISGLVAGIFTERRVTVDIAGPVGIAVITGQVVQLGFAYLLQFAGILSANLALLNALPFPALDGGRFFLVLVEAIRRRALRRGVEQMVHAAGFVALIALILVVTYHDIATFGGSILASVKAAVGFGG